MEAFLCVCCSVNVFVMIRYTNVLCLKTFLVREGHLLLIFILTCVKILHSYYESSREENFNFFPVEFSFYLDNSDLVHFPFPFMAIRPPSGA